MSLGFLPVHFLRRLEGDTNSYLSLAFTVSLQALVLNRIAQNTMRDLPAFTMIESFHRAEEFFL